jgi:hypothetical protein
MTEQKEIDLTFEHLVRKSVLKQQRLCTDLLDQIMETQSRYIKMTMHFESEENDAKKFERQIIEATQKCFEDLNEDINYTFNEIKTSVGRIS